MQTFKLQDMIRGWFVGNFEPTAYKTASGEVAIKSYRKNDRENSHYHMEAVEITAVISGKVKMNDQILSAGDIVKIEREEACSFQCLEDAVTVVYKSTSFPNDKYDYKI